jgi:hypothetical protein
MTVDVGQYEVLKTRAMRNFALCVVSLQDTPTSVFSDTIEREWRAKADRIDAALVRAAYLVHHGNLDLACAVLKTENESR